MNKIQPETIIATVKGIGKDISTEEATRLLEAMETMIEIAGTAPLITMQMLDPIDDDRVIEARISATTEILLHIQLLQVFFVVKKLATYGMPKKL